MKALSCAVCCLVVIILAGCASSNVTAYQPYQGKIARPDRIIVYDFAATPSELPSEVAIAGQGMTGAPLTPAQLATVRLGNDRRRGPTHGLRGCRKNSDYGGEAGVGLGGELLAA